MSTTWKYANLPADQRIKLVRSGNSEVYNSEMARTKSVIQSREALGLDTTAQINWANTLGYNYNLSNAEKMGISADNVSKKGYGERLSSSYTPPKTSSKDSGFRTQSASSLHRQALGLRKEAQDRKIKSQYAAYKQNAIDSMEESLSVLREDLINKGAGINGGKMISEELRANAALTDTLASIDTAMAKALEQNADYYDNLINEYNNSLVQQRLYEQGVLTDFEKWQAEYFLKKQDTESDNAQAAINAQNEKEKWQSAHALDAEKQANDKEKWQAEHELNVEKENNDKSQWQAEHDFEIQKEQTDNNQWQAEHALDVEKENNDKQQWQAEYALDVQKEKTDYDIWLAEQGLK